LKIPGGPKKALSTLYSDQKESIKKSITKKLEGGEKNWENNEDLKTMSEMWDKDKLKNKEAIAELN
jgi:hypothetical protein